MSSKNKNLSGQSEVKSADKFMADEVSSCAENIADIGQSQSGSAYDAGIVNGANDKLADTADDTLTNVDNKACDASSDKSQTTENKPWYLSARPKKTFTDYISKSETLLQIIVIIVTSLIRAVAMNVFAVPNKLSLGGVAGISSILYNALGWNVAATNFILNIPLLILAFFFINKRFAILTLIATLLTSLAIEYFNFLPVFTDDIFVAALMSGALMGIAIGFLLKVNCSSGGTDIIGLLIQNKAPEAKVVWIFFLINAAISIVTGIVFKSLPLIIYSFVCIFASTYASDVLQRGFVSTFELKIITSKPQEISDYVIQVLHRSTTMIHAEGMYTHTIHPYLICIVRKRQLAELKRAIKVIDPHSFTYVTMVNDTIGKGFDNTIVPSSKIK
ncbi:MAG: YitT family protein [Clostridia bacterium]